MTTLVFPTSIANNKSLGLTSPIIAHSFLGVRWLPQWQYSSPGSLPANVRHFDPTPVLSVETASTTAYNGPTIQEMGRSSMKASVFMARYLRSRGLERAFGLPGGEAIPLMEGLRQVDVPFILTHHESAAGYMAGATGFLTGVPGLCIVTRGPGAANMVSAVAMAHLDRLPLIAISGDLEPSQIGSFTHQWLDLVSIFKPITKSSGR